MPGRNNKSKKACTHRDKTGSGNKEYDWAPVRFCSAHDCFKYQNLRECARCKCASYCSVECQKKNWKQHKLVCDHNVAQLALTPDGAEPLLQRNLRHWVARFNATLLNACIRALNLKEDWERIGQGALVLFMEPRPHHNLGSRWRIRNAGIFRNEDIEGVLQSIGRGLVQEYRERLVPMHAKERARLQQSSGGAADYASIIILAGNVGADTLPGDHPFTMRFTPLDVWKSMVASMPMATYGGDWCEDLKDQVHDDRPLKHAPPTN
ncbi:hypothetical protein C8F04DRAFT_1123604 [Mycena alexandri]|uniref:MYND-type domain-containing protein n=1 Tax=Mycena alexandri TaxID=1745969 RepID=A0AAD6SG29_9AGAR|nr:hypothetical protein C8F04DRAFT_1123604 [Mycena alexandri]